MARLYSYSIEQVLPDGSTILVARNHAESAHAAIDAAQLPSGENYRSYEKEIDNRKVEPAVTHDRFACAVVVTIKAKDTEEAFELIEKRLRGSEINFEYSANAAKVPADIHPNETAWNDYVRQVYRPMVARGKRA